MNERDKIANKIAGLMFTLVLSFTYMPYLAIKASKGFDEGVAQAQASARSLAGPDIIVAFDAISQSIIAGNCVENIGSSLQRKPINFSDMFAPKEIFAKNKAKGAEAWIQCFNNQVAMMTVSTDSEQLEGLRALSARLATNPNPN